MIQHTDSCRACHSVTQRTVKSLHLATKVLRQEGLVTETFTAGGLSCEALRELWGKWSRLMLDKVKGEKKFRLASALKGTKSLFDEPCFTCDRDLAAAAKEEWARRALGRPQFTRPEVLADIKSRARWYMGKSWWREKKGVAYVPDQQGCAELERGCGGTLGVARPWDAIKVGPLGSGPTEGDITMCRLGTAKAKGKMRVVTMQAARTKRILRPVHTAAYNHLSRQPWLVRGDVNADHFKRVKADQRPGEKFNSGDFEASTDNLNKDAVLAVVEVLCEALPERRKKVLLASFEETWVEWNGEKRKVVRGSMMGNLLSFVVLCLLNKICLDQARQKVEDCGPIYREALVNGDDLFFSGGDEVFDAWLSATREVGFVINLKKTMRSERYGDLNSTTYDMKKSRFIPRLSFGFLGTNIWKEPAGTVADSLFSLVRQLKFSTAAWLLNIRPIQEIFDRAKPALSIFPRRWWQFLVKKKWFRAVITGVDNDVTQLVQACNGLPIRERTLPYVLGPPLCESNPVFEGEIFKLEQKVIRSRVSDWAGEMVVPPGKKMMKRKLKIKKEKYHLSRGSPVWTRLWLEPVLRQIEFKYPHMLLQCLTTPWIDDQPGLTTTVALVRKGHISFAPPPLFDSILVDGVYVSQTLVSLTDVMKPIID
ncbi:RNA dependent RNA polymerase [Plasmopara viticola lesion associated ourmia-like virus 2]|uniref:RNA dependent RNA polymerase n=1 Tax=Plasmopara viticola lesion associated ourmia-like virus 2 TaxID=2686487 RepID=A0ABX6FK03_9VIRU|nr:RNA dependent RNA polymerase [Plasmopara viticola lesion associated ourmia-like virus 2]QGY72532.1 RNA dependent RNA polymerase [Plasmopara viticola lesion associated ourmia-like virus 2]